MSANLQIVCCDTLTTSPCILISTDNRKVMFNANEGIQRLCVEYKIRINKIEQICLTALGPETIGGLPGLCLTAADSGKQRLVVTGPAGLEDFWRSTRHFMHRDTLKVEIKESKSTIINDYGDLKIISIPITIIDKHTSNTTITKKVCYISEIPKQVGKFDVEKAKALNIPKGPIYGQLKNGIVVTLDNGQVIHPSEVLGESEPARNIAIICQLEIDEMDLLESLVTNSEWNRFLKNPIKACLNTEADITETITTDILECIVHLSPLLVIRHPMYQNWIESFASTVTHIFIGKGTCIPISSFVATTFYANKLHYVCPDLFPYLNISDGHDNSMLHHYDFQSDENRSKTLTKGLPIENINDSSCNLINILSSTIPSSNDITMKSSIKVVTGYPLLQYNLLPSRIRGLIDTIPINIKSTVIPTLRTSHDPLHPSTLSLLSTDHLTIPTHINITTSSTMTVPPPSIQLIKTLQRELQVFQHSLDNISLYPSIADRRIEIESAKTYYNTIQQSVTISDDVNGHTTPNVKSLAISQSNFEVNPISATNNNHTTTSTTSINNDEKQVPPLFKNKLEDHDNHYQKYINSNSCIYFLGTGCAIPSKYRNVTGICIKVSGGLILLDAGEGSWSQLLRLFNNTTITDSDSSNSNYNNSNNNSKSIMDVEVEVSQQLKMVWISHPHADHHLGLITIIRERKKAFLSSMSHSNKDISQEMDFEPLLLFAPPSVLAFLREYELLDELIVHSYIGLSNRLLDANDNCIQLDVYWNEDNSSRNIQEDDPSPSIHMLYKNNNEKIKEYQSDKNEISIDDDIIEVMEIDPLEDVSNRSSSFLNRQMDTISETYLHTNGTNSSSSTSTSDKISSNNSIRINQLSYGANDSSNENDNKRKELLLLQYQKEIDFAYKTCKTLGLSVAINTNSSNSNSNNICSTSSDHNGFPIEDLGALLGIRNVKVIHCQQAYGVRLDVSEGWSLVYSGDTRPCSRLVSLGKNTTILIHEATFDDTKSLEAKVKNHSTISEANIIGKRMNAYRTILTHFSQRYPGVPPAPVTGFEKMIVAFDFMSIKLKDISWAPSVTNFLMDVFPTTEDDTLNENEEEEVILDTQFNKIPGNFAVKDCNCEDNNSNFNSQKNKSNNKNSINNIKKRKNI